MPGKFLNKINDFLNFINHLVVINGLVSQWSDIEPGVSQRSILRPLLFFIYINELSENLLTNAKVFVDDTSLFSVVSGANTSATHLNIGLRKIKNWAFQWKIIFHPEPRKQA